MKNQLLAAAAMIAVTALTTIRYNGERHVPDSPSADFEADEKTAHSLVASGAAAYADPEVAKQVAAAAGGTESAGAGDGDGDGQDGDGQGGDGDGQGGDGIGQGGDGGSQVNGGEGAASDAADKQVTATKAPAKKVAAKKAPAKKTAAKKTAAKK